jgi:hypothetical protein
MSVARPPICSECGEEMEAGFIPDLSPGAVLQSRWHPGVAEKKNSLAWRSVMALSNSPGKKRFPLQHIVARAAAY